MLLNCFFLFLSIPIPILPPPSPLFSSLMIHPPPVFPIHFPIFLAIVCPNFPPPQSMNIARLLEIGTDPPHHHHHHFHHHSDPHCAVVHRPPTSPTLAEPHLFANCCASSSVVATFSNGKENRQNKTVTTQQITAQTLTNSLKFGIENILQPEFGIQSASSLAPFPRQHGHSSHAQLHQAVVPPHRPHSFCPHSTPNSFVPPPSSNCDAFPSWIFCTRYSDRPSSGPRTRKSKRRELAEEEKRPRTAFTTEQLDRLKTQFVHSRYLTEKKRQELAHELGLNECQIKIWFQNKRAKMKKSAQRVHHQLPTPHGLLEQPLFKRQ